jgi:hypothetical protein
MNSGDVRKVKKLARRLGVRDSDIIRFAVKGMLARLGPLYDTEVTGRNLVPVFVEFGAELLRFFEIDSARLDGIINEGVDPVQRVERDDIALLASTQEPYAALKLSELGRTDHGRATSAELSESMRQYLYGKYLYRGNGESHPAPEPTRTTVSAARPELAEG